MSDIKAKKLTPAMADLLEDMQTKGVTCFYMRCMGRFNPNAYYFRSDNHDRCTAQVKALLERGLVEKFDKQFGGDHRVRAIKGDA